jgi:hypothetical protein
MFLFSRTLLLTGPPAESGAYAADVRQYVADVTGRDLALWAVSFGAPLGTMVFSMRVGGIADLQSLGAQLLADAEYHKRLAAGRDFVTTPAVDMLARPLLGDLDGDAPPVGSVATVTTATMAGGT